MVGVIGRIGAGSWRWAGRRTGRGTGRRGRTGRRAGAWSCRGLHVHRGPVGCGAAAGAFKGTPDFPSVHFLWYVPYVHLFLAVSSDGDAGKQAGQIIAVAGSFAVRAGGCPLIGLGICSDSHEGGQLTFLHILAGGILGYAGSPELGSVVSVKGQTGAAVGNVIDGRVVQIYFHIIGKVIGIGGDDGYLHPVVAGTKGTAVHRISVGVIPAVAHDTAALRAGSNGCIVYPVHGYGLFGKRD